MDLALISKKFSTISWNEIRTCAFEELEKNVKQLLTDALEDQSMTIRRIGVRVSDLSEIKGQSDITNFF